jgi:enamine deaminase RidA (YjgF/YER057c/UK114 family)
MSTRRNIAGVCLVALAMGAASSFAADGITRVPYPRPTGIATSASVPAGMKLHFISGQLPTIDPKAPGDMYSQTKSVISKLVAALKALGLTPDSAVKATAFLMGDPAKGGEMDFDGYSKAWQEVWPGTKVELPARSTVKVSGLALPGALLEIELIAAGPN